MDKTDFTKTGGMPMKLDDFLWMLGDQKVGNNAIYDAYIAHLLAYSDNFIIQGCVYDGVAGTLTEGWVMLDGELLKVDAQTGLTQIYFEKVTTYDTDGDKVFKDSSVNQTYEKNRATLTATSGNLNITIAKRIQPPFRIVGAAGEPAYNLDFVASTITYPLGFRLDEFGYLELRGSFRAPTFHSNPPLGVPIFTLPIGYRPSFEIPIISGVQAGYDATTTPIFLKRIKTNGEVYIGSSVGSPAYVTENFFNWRFKL